MNRRLLPFASALMTVLLLVIVSTWLNQTTKPNRSVYRPPTDLYGPSDEVSLSELATFANNLNYTLYLPTELPAKLELTAIYIKEGPFSVMVVYSAEGNKEYHTAELTIEIIKTDLPPTYEQVQAWTENSEDQMALKINDWVVRVNEKASTGADEEHRKKYGDYQLLAYVWIEDYQYLINAPTLTTDEVLQLIRGMSLQTL